MNDRPLVAAVQKRSLIHSTSSSMTSRSWKFHAFYVTEVSSTYPQGLHNHNPFLQGLKSHLFLVWVSQLMLSLNVFRLKFCTCSLPPEAWNMYRFSYCPRYVYSSLIWWRVQITNDLLWNFLRCPLTSVRNFSSFLSTILSTWHIHEDDSSGTLCDSPDNVGNNDCWSIC
jgi:hypothetical protein